MKILHIIYDDVGNPWCGGGGALRAFKVNQCLAKNNDITVITGNYTNAKNEMVDNVRFIRIGSGLSYFLSRLSFSLSIPYFINKFESDIVINECSYFSPCFADIYTKRPVINIIHHLIGKHSFRIYPLLGLYPFLVEKMFLKTIKNLITSAEQIRNDIQRTARLEKSVSIANGVAEEWYDLTPEEKPFVLFLGRIDIYMKGLDILLESFAGVDKNHDIILKIAGGGKSREVLRLKNLIELSGMKNRIECLGKVSEEEKKELMRTCQFLVMPSRFEGWGITALEANAAGKPVLGTRIKGLSEAVLNNETAILVAPGNPGKVTVALKQLLDDNEFRARLGKQGRQWAKKNAWRAVAAKQYKFYKTVLEVPNKSKKGDA
jgi:glycogen synthase